MPWRYDKAEILNDSAKNWILPWHQFLLVQRRYWYWYFPYQGLLEKTMIGGSR